MKIFLSLISISFFTLGSSLANSEITLDLGGQDVALSEGTERYLSPEQMKEFLPWANTSQIFLKNLLEYSKDLPKKRREKHLLLGIKEGVLASAPKNSELLMRYVLNRGVLVHQTLVSETDANLVRSMNTRIRVLEQSIVKALEYYESDLSRLQAQEERRPIPFAEFGKEYYKFLFEISKSIFDASAQYEVSKMSLEFLQWDLYRDLEVKAYNPNIVIINNLLKLLPTNTEAMSDQDFIVETRQIRRSFRTVKDAPDFQDDLYGSNDSFIVSIEIDKSSSFLVEARSLKDLVTKCRSKVNSIFEGSSSYIAVGVNKMKPVEAYNMYDWWETPDEKCGVVQALAVSSAFGGGVKLSKYRYALFAHASPGDFITFAEGNNIDSLTRSCINNLKKMNLEKVSSKRWNIKSIRVSLNNGEFAFKTNDSYDHVWRTENQICSTAVSMVF